MQRSWTDWQPAQRNVILVLLLGLAAASWALLAWQAGAAGSDMDMAMNTPTMGLRAPLFLAVWVVMMAAMMFPAAAPMILTFQKVQAGKHRRGETFVATWVFVAAYMLVWAMSGVVAYAGAVAAEAVAARTGLSSAAAARTGGAVLILAGLYQLTPLKERCLSKCQTPMGFVMTAWRDGTAGALRMGMLHGIYCLGCCWMLFVILFPLGIMNIAAMAIVTVAIFGEKTLSRGRKVARATAVALIAYGAVVAVLPRTLPTYMEMGGMVSGTHTAPMDMKTMPMPGDKGAPAGQ